MGNTQKDLRTSYFSVLRPLTTWHCSHLLLSAGRAAIDRYLLAAGPTAANPPQRRASAEWWDRQRDGRTPDSFIDPLRIVCEQCKWQILIINKWKWRAFHYKKLVSVRSEYTRRETCLYDGSTIRLMDLHIFYVFRIHCSIRPKTLGPLGCDSL